MLGIHAEISRIFETIGILEITQIVEIIQNCYPRNYKSWILY